MRVVIDTNVLLVSVFPQGKYHWLYEMIEREKIEVLITNDILLEYEEIISRKLSIEVARNLIQMLLFSNNVLKVDIFYQWNLIDADPDDNKFIDCAIAGGADYLISNDKHFNTLLTNPFPGIKKLTLQEFEEIVNPF